VLLETAGIPSLGSDALALSVRLDKAWAHELAAAAGVLAPDFHVVRSAAEARVLDELRPARCLRCSASWRCGRRSARTPSSGT
jgi:D-alanine-D-alanine ligase